MIFKFGMLSIAVTILLIGTSLNEAKSQEDQSMVSFMTYNLRFDTDQDGVNRWDNRKDHVAALIRLYKPGFVGQQEGLIHQVEFLDDQLEEYDWIGVGRDDGEEAGELSSLHFDTSRYELIQGTDQTIWLSETPDQPGKGWDADFPRVLTFGKFRDKQSDKEFYVFNTHFDHVGQTAREESAKLILSKISELAEDDPYFLMGDFNITEENPAYEILTNSNPPLKDAFYNSENPHVGPLFTFEGFEVKSGSDQRRIDYIFVSPGVDVKTHAVLSHFRNGHYPSDHLPVYTEVVLE